MSQSNTQFSNYETQFGSSLAAPPPYYEVPNKPTEVTVTTHSSFHTQQGVNRVFPDIESMGFHPTTMFAVPVTCKCPRCESRITTEVEYKVGSATWIMMCVCLLSFPCLAWMPFVLDMYKDAHHHCPNCKKCIGVFKRNRSGRR